MTMYKWHQRNGLNHFLCTVHGLYCPLFLHILQCWYRLCCLDILRKFLQLEKIEENVIHVKIKQTHETMGLDQIELLYLCVHPRHLFKISIYSYSIRSMNKKIFILLFISASVAKNIYLLFQVRMSWERSCYKICQRPSFVCSIKQNKTTGWSNAEW